MRFFESLVSFAFILSIAACAGQDDEGSVREGKIELGQDITVATKPRDVAFQAFEKNWEQRFVTASVELTLPVRIRYPEPKEEPWEPMVRAECIYSSDAGGLVPQVTLTWLEPAPSSGPVNAASTSAASGTTSATKGRPVERQVNDSDQSPSSGEGDLRLDLALHNQGFERNYYSSALSTAKLERFKLPSNSGLVADTEAVLLTGPGLFPKLIDFSKEILQEAGTQRQFDRRTLVLRDFNEGLTYSIRVCVRDENGWHEEKRYAFLTPVCPHSF